MLMLVLFASSSNIHGPAGAQEGAPARAPGRRPADRLRAGRRAGAEHVTWVWMVVLVVTLY